MALREALQAWVLCGRRFVHRRPTRKVVAHLQPQNDEPRQFWMSRKDTLQEVYSPEISKRWFPYNDHFILDEETSTTSEMVIRTLGPIFPDDRKQKFDLIIANRTFSICPVVEGLHDIGNICAVFRTAEAFGLQSVHVIANSECKRYKQTRGISMGAEKWLDVEVWDTTKDCIQKLKDRGYRIAVTDIGPETIPIQEMNWTIPTAIIFGNEYQGPSQEIYAAADVKCHIPMVGMVDSFNVSVAAGILLYHVVNDRLEKAGTHGDLSLEEQQILRAEFYLRNKRNMNDVIQRLLSHKQTQAETSNPSASNAVMCSS